jgi:hypothetical protein
VLLSSDEDGPPYDALWVDENPFEPRELSVEAELPAGGSLRTSITLNPLEITETADISSVAVDATVVDPKGRFVNNLTAPDFALLENGAHRLSWCHKAVNRRCSRSSSTAVRIADPLVGRRATAVRLLAIAAEDPVVVAPFSNSHNGRRRIATVSTPSPPFAIRPEPPSSMCRRNSDLPRTPLVAAVVLVLTGPTRTVSQFRRRREIERAASREIDRGRRHLGSLAARRDAAEAPERRDRRTRGSHATINWDARTSIAGEVRRNYC